MTDNQHPPHSRRQSAPPRMYSPALQPLFQSLLSTLADLNLAYDRDREKLSESMKDANLRTRALEKLKQQHHERREPYLQQLAILQDRIQRGWH
ncbi:hypothetical protein [Microvirga aerophila]|nr:hypothetical protein [Microvirga aerophila]